MIPNHICTAYSIEFLALGQVNNATWGHNFINSKNHFLIRKLTLKVGVYYSYKCFLKLLLETFNVDIKGNMFNGVIKLAVIR